MRAPSAAELLDLWEDGLARTHAQRALALLMTMFPGVSRDTLGALSIGQRDAELLRLREALWGPRMAAIAECLACRERLELPLDIREILADSNPTGSGEIAFSLADYSIVYRLPTTLDIAAAESEETPESARSLILDRCVLSARQGTALVNSEQLPPEVVAGIAESMAEADPLADIQLNLTCPACRHTWRASFDIVSFLSTEVEAWAWRILSEVHTLAGAYGWTERETLALSPTRRQFYLEMVGA